jgi:hypothetical protein
MHSTHFNKENVNGENVKEGNVGITGKGAAKGIYPYQSATDKNLLLAQIAELQLKLDQQILRAYQSQSAHREQARENKTLKLVVDNLLVSTKSLQ